MQLITGLVKCFKRSDMHVLVNALAVGGGEKEFSRISPRAKKLNFNATHHQSQNVKDHQ